MTDDSLKQVSLIAQLAGFAGHTDLERGAYVVDVSLADGRAQRVHIRPFTDQRGKALVTFFSVCARVRSRRFSRDHAIALLEMNGNPTPFVRFGLREEDGYMMVVVMVEHLLGTLDPEEFLENTMWVALRADQYEERGGGDDVY